MSDDPDFSMPFVEPTYLQDLADQRADQRQILRYLPDQFVQPKWPPTIDLAEPYRRDVECRIRDLVDAKLDEIGMAEALDNHVVQQIDVLLRARFKFSGALGADIEDGLTKAKELIPPPPDAPPIAFDDTGGVLEGIADLLLLADLLADDGYSDLVSLSATPGEAPRF